MKFMVLGKAMVDYATEGDLEGFQDIFDRSKDLHHLMFWHVQKAFKEAVKFRHLMLIEYIVEDLDLSLNHETFKGFFHMFMFSAKMDDMEPEETQ